MSRWSALADWGSTRMRLWRMVDGAVAACGDGPGIGTLDGPPAPALRTALAPWIAESGPPLRIVLCGMAGARNGLHEAGYVDCPADVAAWRSAAARLAFDGIPVTIAAGCASARDVMRGEETQVFGAIARDRALGQGRKTVVLPGTHSKWVQLDEGRITGLHSFMTGELYALLQGSSLFAIGNSAPDDGDGFATGLALVRDTSGALGELFQARVAQLRHGRTAGWARGLLSGLLIGGEAAEMRGAGELPAQVTLIGDGALTDRYGEALGAFGVATTSLPGDACVLAGLELFDADD